jgi:hypothetical protein
MYLHMHVTVAQFLLGRLYFRFISKESIRLIKVFIYLGSLNDNDRIIYYVTSIHLCKTA